MAKPSLWGVALWAKSESEKLSDEWPIGSPLESRVLRTWERNQPRMMCSLRRWKAAEPLAHVLVDRCIKSERRYLRAGLPPCDARQEAEMDWLMLEPEEDVS
jgi:hypothetical protein